MKLFLFSFLIMSLGVDAQQIIFMPQNVKKAFTNQTRSMDGNPGKNYWQNTGHFKIELAVAPPQKTVSGSETITYINNSPKSISNIVVKLILNIHSPGAGRMKAASADYLTTGIHIDKYMENGKELKFPNAGAGTWAQVQLDKPVSSGDSVQLSFKWHYDMSEESGREGKLDSTTFFLAYFYPRVAVMDDVHGWDYMDFTDAQEFYNDFNDYDVAVTVPKNFLVWGTGDLVNAAEVLQAPFLEKFNRTFTSDHVINIVTQKDLQAKNVTSQNSTNTWKWKATNISDVAYCVSDQYVWDAASVIVDKNTGRRASCQSAYKNTATNFHNQVKHIQHSLDWFSNNWPGVPYPFPKSTIIQGFADMEYPMMANDSPQDDDVFQRFIAEHEVGHSYFPFYMGINEHRYGFMDEGWTTAFEYLIGQEDLGKERASKFFKQFRVARWASNPSDETQIPIITPVNILSGQAMGHNEYGKPALAYLALKDMLGDEIFKKSLQGFMQRWHGKHPIPWDMFNSFSNISGKDLSWFFSNWFTSNDYMDITMDQFGTNTDGYAITVKNTGGFAIPFDVVIEYSDGSNETFHQTAGVWEKNLQFASINIKTKKKITWFKLETGIYIDADEMNNSWGNKRVEAGAASLQLKPADLDKYLGIYSSKDIPLKLTISKDGSNLQAQATGQDAFPLTYTGKDNFNFEEDGIEINFITAQKRLILKQGGRSYPFTRD